MLRDKVLKDLESKLARLIMLREVVETTDLQEYRFGKQIAVATINRRIKENKDAMFSINKATERELATYIKDNQKGGTLC